MRIIRFILQKEFLQVFRNKGMLPILFVMPVIQLLVLSFAATFELKDADFALIDRDRSGLSAELSAKFQAGGHFKLKQVYDNEAQALKAMDDGQISLILNIPQHFEHDVKRTGQTEIQFIIDAVNGTSAGLIQAYAAAIIQDFNADILTEATFHILPAGGAAPQLKRINLIPQNWYNPSLNYITFMVPGILVVLVTVIGLFLSGMNIVREQELGTIEQLNVSPITKTQFMLGKLLPFWMIGMIDLLIGFALARYGFQVPFLGNLGLILFVSGIYLAVVQAMGLFISTITHTQQQAMFIAWFIMVIFILMGGLFTPIESMPLWAQRFTLLNPISYFIKIMRMVLLKGAGWAQIQAMVAILSVMGLAFLMLAIRRYSKTA